MAANVRKLNIVSIVVIVIYLSFNMAYFLYQAFGTFESLDDNFAHTQSVLSWVTAIAFLLLAIVFLWASMGMIKALKQNFREFYD